MKKILITLAAAAIAGAAFAQGKVSFGNDSSHLYFLNYSLLGDSLGPIPVSPLPSGYTLVTALYAGTTPVSLSLQTSFALDALGWLTDGRQVNKNVILSGVPGGSVANFQIFITELGATLPATVVGGTVATFSGHCYFGTSGLFTATPGSSITYPGLISGGPAGSTWVGGISVTGVVPEPSVVALSALIAVTMFGFRRRH